MTDREPVPERVVQRILNRIEVDSNGCWVWQGARFGSGYGHIAWQRANHQFHRSTHRSLYEALVGDVPDGLDLDHLCRNRVCCNVDHLEPVTRSVNLRRGVGIAAQRAGVTQCPQGHEYTLENTRRDKKGRRTCVECTRARNRAYYHSNRDRRRAYNREWHARRKVA